LVESKNTLYKASWVTPTLAAASQPVACSWLTCSVAVVILTSHAACNRCCRVQELLALTPDQIRERLGDPAEAELVTYCHSGQRSELAAEILRSLGYRAANYRGSWHEWSRDESLPAETG